MTPKYIDDFLYVTREHAGQAATNAAKFRDVGANQAETWQAVADVLTIAADKIKAAIVKKS